MDEELTQCAALVLRNAFWTEFSALCNKYIAAHEGLNVEGVDYMLGDLTSIFGRDKEARSNAPLNIWTQQAPVNSCYHNTLGWSTLAEALAYPTATEIHLQGEKVLERIDGEWVFCQMY